jgi:hypothetical protein
MMDAKSLSGGHGPWDYNGSTMQKPLIIIGCILLITGLLWPWIGRLPLGRLPGDIVINRPNMKIYIPITTMIVLSLLISLIMKLFRK